MKNTGVVNIRGKEYQTVALRVSNFRDKYPAPWRLVTSVLERNETVVVMKAEVISPEGLVIATGHAEEYRKASEINKTSALENCETSAIGRALASLGIGGTEFASADEVARAVSGEKGTAPVINPVKESAKNLDADPVKVAKVVSALVDLHAEEAAAGPESGIDWEWAYVEQWEPLTNDEKIAVWNALQSQSKVRARVKKAQEAIKAREPKAAE